MFIAFIGVFSQFKKFYYIDILDPWVIKSTPGGKRGVPGVPKEELLLYINGLSMFLWCPYGVPMVSLRDTNNSKWSCGAAIKSFLSSFIYFE